MLPSTPLPFTARLITRTLACALGAGLASAQLKVDFNSLSQDNGPHPDAGYESYDASHETAADFTQVVYAVAFGTGPANVTLTPAWPNSTAPQVMQMIDRGMAFDDNWLGEHIDLLTDWIGADSRTANGGNGDWDRSSGTPTYFTLTLGGLPAGIYQWTSYHHDTEMMWSDFQIEVSTDGGSTYGDVIDMEVTASSPGGTPPDPDLQTGMTEPSPGDLNSTFRTNFTADGSSDVVLRFAPYVDGVDGTGVHKQFFVMNGFELDGPVGTNYCIATDNSTGNSALMSGTGSVSVSATDLVLRASPVPTQPGLFMYGDTQSLTPFGNGFLCLSGTSANIYPPIFASQGIAELPLSSTGLLGSVITAGSTWNFQYIYRDLAAGGARFNLSDAVSITFQP